MKRDSNDDIDKEHKSIIKTEMCPRTQSLHAHQAEQNSRVLRHDRLYLVMLKKKGDFSQLNHLYSELYDWNVHCEVDVYNF